jgi:signal transduction histidine kinase
MSLHFQSVKFFGEPCPDKLKQSLSCPVYEFPTPEDKENRIEIDIVNYEEKLVTVTARDIELLSDAKLLNLPFSKSYFYYSKSSLDLTDQLLILFKRIEEDVLKLQSWEQKKGEIQKLEGLIEEKSDFIQSQDLIFKKIKTHFQSEQESNSQFISLFHVLEAQDSLEEVLNSLKAWSSSILQQDVDVLVFSEKEASSFVNYFEDNIYFQNNEVMAPILSQPDSFIAIRVNKNKLNEIHQSKLLNIQSLFNQKVKFLRAQALQAEEFRIWKLALDQFSFPIAIINQNGIPYFKNKALIDLNLDLNSIVTGKIRSDEVVINGTQFVLERTSFKIDPESYEILVFHNKSDERERLLKSISSEKFNIIGRLSDKIAHELSNPIGGIQNLIEVLLQEADIPKNQKDDLEQIRLGAIRTLKIIKSLKDFANNTNSDNQVCNVFELIREALVFSKSLTRNMKILFRDSSNPILVSVQPDLFKQVIFNLIQNSAQACQKKGIIEIEVIQLKEQVRISVSDNGPGIPEHLRMEIFEPSFTTKKLGEGTGLGLAFVKRTVESWEGHIFCTTSSSLGGAQFVIDLPVAF